MESSGITALQPQAWGKTELTVSGRPLWEIGELWQKNPASLSSFHKEGASEQIPREQRLTGPQLDSLALSPTIFPTSLQPKFLHFSLPSPRRSPHQGGLPWHGKWPAEAGLPPPAHHSASPQLINISAAGYALSPSLHWLPPSSESRLFQGLGCVSAAPLVSSGPTRVWAASLPCRRYLQCLKQCLAHSRCSIFFIFEKMLSKLPCTMETWNGIYYKLHITPYKYTLFWIISFSFMYLY